MKGYEDARYRLPAPFVLCEEPNGRHIVWTGTHWVEGDEFDRFTENPQGDIVEDVTMWRYSKMWIQKKPPKKPKPTEDELRDALKRYSEAKRKRLKLDKWRK